MLSFQIKASSNGQFYVVQVAKNGEPLNTSELLSSHVNALINIRSVIIGLQPIVGKEFKVVDLTKKETFYFKVGAYWRNRPHLTPKSTKPLTKKQIEKYGL